MRKLESIVKRTAAVIAAATMLAGAVSGCGYESVDDYLKELGILDPYDDEKEEPSSSSTVVYEAQFLEEEVSAEPLIEASIDSIPQNEEAPDISAMAPAADDSFSLAYKNAEETSESDAIKAEREAIGLSAVGIENLKREQEGLYAYERLTDAGKTLYVEILSILQNQARDITVSTVSDDAVELVYDYCMLDHPEIFYVDGYEYTNYSMGDTITRITFSGNYIYDMDEVNRRQTLINEEVNKCLAKAPAYEDDYYAIKYVYEYLISNTEYGMDAEDNQNICSVFLGKRSVCNGYSKAAQYLLNKLGVRCTLVTGTVNTKNSTDVRHAWNMVLCNNAYYYMDVTWGDASYQTVSGESADVTKLPEVNYDYLNVSTNEISKNHTLSDLIYMPVCNSMTDNYYVREDEYFTTAELSLVGDLFDRRYKDGSNNVTIKCATDAVYESLFKDLITDRQVFDYLQGDTSQVSYTTFEDTRTIIFWI